MTTIRFKDTKSYTIWEAERLAAWSKPAPATEDKEVADPGPESVLSNKIVNYCKEHGYPCQCFRQSKKAKGFLVPGLPD